MSSDAAVDAPPSQRPAPAASAALDVRGLSQVFRSRGGQPVAALRELDLSVGDGEFVSLVGPSGCGKSTLLMILAGLQTATSGQVQINGAQVRGPSPLIGLAFQRDNLLEWRTVLDNVLVQAQLRGWSKAAHRDRARELLDMVGLSGFLHAYPRELSGGMRQRVALCRSLLHQPSILLLDEPFGAVDAMTREQLNLDVAKLCALSGVTAVMVTHDINEAAFMSDRVLVLSARPGRLAGVVTVPVPTPRDADFRQSDEFVTATRAIRAVLESAHRGDQARDGQR